MNEVLVIDRILSLFVQIFRPLSRIKGSARICRTINALFLFFGATPVQIAELGDSSRMWVDLRSNTEWYTFYSGVYDEELILFVNRILKSGGNFLDVGGNIGMYAVRVAKTTSNIEKIYCVEPVPSNIKRIKRNCDLNGVSKKVTVLSCALSDSDSVLSIVLREDFERGSETGNASIAISDLADGGFSQISIQAYRLDDIAEKFGILNVSMIKVDIEGHEDLFFAGSKKFIQRYNPVILTEVNNWYYKKRGTSINVEFSKAIPDYYGAYTITTRKSEIVLEFVGNLDSLHGVQNIALIANNDIGRVRNVLTNEA